MKRNLTVFLVITIGFLLQTAVFPFLPTGGICPNILLILVVSFAMIQGSRTGLWVGFFCGLLMDIFFGSYLGVYAMLYMYTGAVSGIFQKRFYPDDLKLPLVLIGAADLVCNLTIYVTMFYLRGIRNFRFYLRTLILPECVYTIVVTIFIYVILLRINQWIDRVDD